MKKFSCLYIIFIAVFFSCKSGHKEANVKSFTAYGPAEYLWERWTYPNDHFDEAYFTKVMKEARKKSYEKDGLNDVSWRLEGPLNIGGRINVMVINPDDDEELWVGTAAGGVFKSIDSGDSWEAVGDEFSNMAIASIAIDPSNTERVYVGTGDPSLSGYPKTGDGVYKTEDGGITWEHIGLSELGVITQVIIDPITPERLYLASMGTPYYQSEDRGVYRSEDGGASWEQVLYLADYAGISSLVIHPSMPDTLYAAGWDRIRSNTESINFGNHSRIYRSYDGGTSWDTLAGGLPQEEMSRASIDISKSNPAVLYASFIRSDDYQYEGVYRSDDHGDTWTETQTADLEGAAGGFGWYFGLIRIDPSNEDIVHVGGVELHSTADGGESWYQSTPTWWLYEVHADMHDVTYDSNGDIYVSTDGGLYRSDDDMASWEYVSYLPITQFYRVTVNPHEEEVYAGGAQDNGTTAGNYENTDTWPRIWGGDGFQVLYAPSNEDMMYVSTQNGNFYISYDGGAFFDPYNSGINEDERVAWDAPIIMSSHDDGVLYTGTTRVYKSFGFSWLPISDVLPGSDGDFLGSVYVISTIAESPLNEEVLYAGTGDGKVWVTENGGEDWTDISSGLPIRYVTDITCSSYEEGRVYVTQSGYKDGDESAHIHRSDDYGQTWVELAGDLPNFGLNNVEILDNSADSILFVASDGGVYYTINSGEIWERAGDNMPIIMVYDIELDYDANRLVAGTFARSIQTLSLDSLIDFSTTVKEEEGIRFSLYPNPVIDVLHIDLPPALEALNWQILDINGRKVKGGSAGLKDISVGELSSGVYFLVLEHNDQRSIRKWIKK